MRRGWHALAVVTALAMMAFSCSTAWADGDPASDVLLSQVAFLPTDTGLSSTQEAQLTGLLHAAARAGAPVRVAVIPDAYDLGSITQLWKKPETYARFLGAELSLVYKHPVIVVMPNGLGLNWPGHSVASAQAQVSRVKIKPGKTGLLDGAMTAVQGLLSAEHVHVSPPAQTAPPPGSSPHRSAARTPSTGAGLSVPAIIAGLAIVLALVLVGYRRLRGRRRERGTGAGAQPAAASAPLAAEPDAALLVASVVEPPAAAPAGVRWRWVAAAGVAALVVAVGGPILAVSLLRGSPARATPEVASSGTPYMLPEGRQPAPNFTLRDQNGQRISLASFRGRNVLITFVDPLCRNLCPLEAHVLNALVDRLPPAQRPAIIAVSVDTWADSHHDLMQDFRSWSLVPQWHWAVGTHAQLAAVWKRYAIGVQVVNKTLAGTTVHYITHTEASYLIDPAGYERALFAWPFAPQDVLTTLRKLSRA